MAEQLRARIGSTKKSPPRMASFAFNLRRSGENGVERDGCSWSNRIRQCDSVGTMPYAGGSSTMTLDMERMRALSTHEDSAAWVLSTSSEEPLGSA